MFSELQCNTELERRSSGSRRVCKCRRHNLRLDEYGNDRRVGIGRRSSDERRTGSDRRSNNKRMVSGSSRPRNLIEIS
ncbi:MAG: hypothetical protein KJO03_04220 [Gammaproteobacteria bacterium]|nr:hypothetical protein [Gammaproteobacteria bacterium]